MRVKEIRAKLGMTQTEFANELGVSRQSISNWERDNFKPTKVVQKLINKLCEEKNVK